MRIDDINEEAAGMIKQNEQKTLYTEEQVRDAMFKAKAIKYVTYSDDEIIESLKKVTN